MAEDVNKPNKKASQPRWAYEEVDIPGNLKVDDGAEFETACLYYLDPAVKFLRNGEDFSVILEGTNAYFTILKTMRGYSVAVCDCSDKLINEIERQLNDYKKKMNFSEIEILKLNTLKRK